MSSAIEVWRRTSGGWSPLIKWMNMARECDGLVSSAVLSHRGLDFGTLLAVAWDPNSKAASFGEHCRPMLAPRSGEAT